MSNTNILAKNKCDYLRVVLLCKGRGADKSSYRPGSDESQWWGRRDALTRCVASFLLGSKTYQGDDMKTIKELVFLFDEDFARLHMIIDDVNLNTFPKEETVIKLWKQAAQNLRKWVEYKGIKCIIHSEPTLQFMTNSSSRNTSNTIKRNSVSTKRNVIEKIDSKREILEYIQKNCSMDFLRDQRINSNPEVVLRKTNRKTLLKIWENWKKCEKESMCDDENSYNSQRLKLIYKALLQFPLEKATRSSQLAPKSKIQKVAGMLHENSDEFPCFHFRPEEIAHQSSSQASYRICLFLGAVRDMAPHEKEILEEVCDASKIPLLRIRFSRVPEFTSKILSLLVFHHKNRVLSLSLKRLIDKANHAGQYNRVTEAKNEQQSTCLNIICTVPKSSKDISVGIEERDQTHWRLVRVIVCSLWRSKLVSSTPRIRHTNILYLVFDDGVIVTLVEREFVRKLAGQHQAAPSEFQILTALVEEINQQSKRQAPFSPSKKSSDVNHYDIWTKKKLAKHLVKSIVKSSPIPITCTVGIESNATNELVSRFYNHSVSADAKKTIQAKENLSPDQCSDHSILVVMDIACPPKFLKPSMASRKGKPGLQEDKPQNPREIYQRILSASRKLQIHTIQQTMIPEKMHHCWDGEATSIIALQQMCYQNRVFARWCFQPCENSGKKRKKPG